MGTGLKTKFWNVVDPLSAYEHAPGKPPLRVRMDITNKCNLLCKMCHYPNTVKDAKFDMEPDLVRKIVDQIFPYTETAVLACQYEPFMSRHIDEVLQIVGQGKCRRIGLVTNATLWNERRIRLMLETEALESIAISIDGGTKETFERIRVNGNWDKLIVNLENFARMKREAGIKHPAVQINTVLMKSTAKELPLLVEIAHRIDAYKIEAIRYLDINPGLGEGIYDWEEVMPQLIEGKRLAKEYGIDLFMPVEDPRLQDTGLTETEAHCNTAEIGGFSEYCEAPWSAVQIYPNGDIHPCGYYGQPFGNMKDQDFLEIWNGAKYLELRRSLAKIRLHERCRQCNPHGYDNIERKGRINA